MLPPGKTACIPNGRTIRMRGMTACGSGFLRTSIRNTSWQATDTGWGGVLQKYGHEFEAATGCILRAKRSRCELEIARGAKQPIGPVRHFISGDCHVACGSS